MKLQELSLKYNDSHVYQSDVSRTISELLSKTREYSEAYIIVI